MITTLVLSYKKVGLQVLSNVNARKEENELNYFFTKTNTGAFLVTFILFLCLWHNLLSQYISPCITGVKWAVHSICVVSCHQTIASPYNTRVKKDLLVVCWILIFNNGQVRRPLRSETMVKIESLKTTEKRKGQRIPLFQQRKPNCGGYRGEKKLLLTMLSLKKARSVANKDRWTLSEQNKEGFEAYLDKWDFNVKACLFSWASFILIILLREKIILWTEGILLRHLDLIKSSLTFYIWILSLTCTWPWKITLVIVS